MSELQPSWTRHWIKGTFPENATEQQQHQRLIESVISLHRMRGDCPAAGNTYAWSVDPERSGGFILGFFLDIDTALGLFPFIHRVPAAVQDAINGRVRDLFEVPS